MAHDKRFVEALTDILVTLQKIPRSEAASLKKGFEKFEQPNFDDFLLEEGLVTKRELLQALSRYYQVPWFDVDGYLFRHHYLHMFPKDFLLRNNMIPLRRDENMMVMITSNPDAQNLLDKIGEHVSYDIRFHVGIRRDIDDAIKEFYDTAYTEGLENIDDQEKKGQTEIAYDIAKERGYLEDE
jgi:hypothetical protein